MIIVNYNGQRYLDRCLQAVLSQKLTGGFEVIVVDNGSHDGSVPYLKTRWPQVKIIDAGANLGFAGGNNLGIAAARGRHIVLLNNDTRVRHGWLQALVDVAEREQNVGAVTSKLVYMDKPNVIQNAGSLVLTDGSGADRGTGEKDNGQYDARDEVFSACGCATLYTRAMLRDVGLFDERFFMYYEDTDLSWRMRLRGWRVIYEPSAVVEHVHSGTSGEWSPFFIFHVDRNRLFMIVKNAPFTMVLRSFVALALLSARYAGLGLLRRLHGGRGGGAAAPGLSRARVHLRVLGSFLRHLPEMLAERRRIRQKRTVSDGEITRWFLPRQEWDRRLAE